MQSFRLHDVHEGASSYPRGTPLHSGHVRGFPVDSVSPSVHPGNGAPPAMNQGSLAPISGVVNTMWPTQPAMVGSAAGPAHRKGEPFYYEAGHYHNARPPTPTRITTFPSTYQHLRQSDGEVPCAAAAVADTAEPGRGPSDSSQSINAELLQLVQRLAPSEAAIFFKAPSPPPSLPVSPRREVDYNQVSLRPRHPSSLVPLRPSPPGSPSRHNRVSGDPHSNSQLLQGNAAGYWPGADLAQQDHAHGLGTHAKQAWSAQPHAAGAADPAEESPAGALANGRNGLRNGFRDGLPLPNGAMARNPNLPSNPIMEERILAQHRHAAAVAYAEQARQQAQKKRKQFEAQQRARARQLEEETAAESRAAMAAAQAVAPVHDPPPAPIEHHTARPQHHAAPPAPASASVQLVDHSSQIAGASTAPPTALSERRSSGESGSTHAAACDPTAQSEADAPPAPPPAAAAGPGSAGAVARASEKKKDVKASEGMSSEGAPAEPKGVVKTYERPWLHHMRKPKEAPAPQPERPVRLPNPEIQSYIAQKRAERSRAKREAKEADAAHHGPLGLRRLTSENARQVGTSVSSDHEIRAW
ncbi:hypothetical protein DUNSADRAFT_15513 [Dunaliella salina]|uniref:Uncharacterized protein n=1 Tax=Dunaliella salina TaxID=3046 RepID=A0ABQ7H1R9_DUNSA|nr:hypothetical protein DUNSADRAFT_15513 [Dunaliella salina]|eukprot:KAF5840803.1 hypothetical protein DUNSADRAFT_15513 [Dunaliella salina]